MTSTIVNAHQNLNLGAYRVNVTTRFGQTLSVEMLTTLTVDTVRMWMQVAKAFEAGERKIEGNAPSFQQLITLASVQPFVTVWGEVMHKGESLTITAHDFAMPKEVLDTAWANMDACNQIREALTKPAPVTPTLIPTHIPERRIPPPEKPAASNPPVTVPVPPTNGSQDIGQIRHVGALKKGLEFVDGELVSFDIAKIELEEVNGNRKWKVYNRFGAKPGDWPAGSLTIYGDNELSMKAVGAALQGLNLQPGGATEGKWTGIYKVRQMGEKTNFYPVRLTA